MKPHRPLLSTLVVVIVLGQALFAQTSKNMSLIGNFGRGEGESKGVYAYGSLVYYGLGNKIQIASFSNPASPVKIASVILTDVVEAVVRTSINSNAYLVATGGSKMWIINVQSPTSPSITATVDVAPGTTCEGVATSGSYAYVAAGDAGLRIYSISTPSAPTLVASIDSLAYSESVVISAPYAYVAADDATFTGRSYIIDVSDPAAPVYKSTILGYGGYHQYMAVRGAYAYICDYNAGLQVINVASPTNPVNVVNVASGYRTASIVFDGNYAYLAVGDEGMKVYNVTNLANPVFLSSITTTGRAAFLSYGAISIGGVPTGHIFIANRGTAPGMSAINVSNPASPTTASFLAALPSASGTAYSSFYAADKVYVAYGTAGIRILDVSTPAQPTLLSTLALGGDCRGVVVKGTTAYVAAMDSGMHVVDASTPSSPVKLSTINTSRARGITLNGNTVYVATRDSGLVILDVSTPASPIWYTPVRGIDVENVAADGNVLGASLWSTIRFFDATIPVNPIQKGDTPPLKNGNEGFAIAGNYAYVPDKDSLRIFNISDLMAPTLVSKIRTGGYGYTAAALGSYCYVASEGTGVRAINISNPVVPVEDGYYDGVPQSRGLSASGEYVYVAEKIDGLSVYRNDLLTSVGGDPGTTQGFALSQNYPNPFNPTTTIGVELARSGFVTLEVFNLLGQRVAVLLQREMAAGTYNVTFNGAGLPSGMYVYRLQTKGFSSARTMMVVK